MPAESPLVQLHRFGQSSWLDFSSRRLIEGASWNRKRGLRGVTSNPTIFEKAISGGASYDGGHAARASQELAEVGVDLDDVVAKLVAHGVKKFQEPFDALLESIRRRAQRA